MSDINQEGNTFDPSLKEYPPEDDGVELFTDANSDELGAALANLMNETWDGLGKILDGAEVTVVAVKYALPAGKLNPILRKYLRDYNDNIDIIAHIYGQTQEEGSEEGGLGADVEYYFEGEPFNPTIITKKEMVNIDVTEPVPVMNHMPSPVDIMQACIDQDTNAPVIYVDEAKEEDAPDDGHPLEETAGDEGAEA